MRHDFASNATPNAGERSLGAKHTAPASSRHELSLSASIRRVLCSSRINGGSAYRQNTPAPTPAQRRDLSRLCSLAIMESQTCPACFSFLSASVPFSRRAQWPHLRVRHQRAPLQIEALSGVSLVSQLARDPVPSRCSQGFNPSRSGTAHGTCMKCGWHFEPGVKGESGERSWVRCEQGVLVRCYPSLYTVQDPSALAPGLPRTQREGDRHQSQLPETRLSQIDLRSSRDSQRPARCQVSARFTHLMAEDGSRPRLRNFVR